MYDRLAGYVEGSSLSWFWRRALFGWEEGLVSEILLLLKNNFLSLNYADCWQWSPAADQKHYSKDGYCRLVISRQDGMV